MYTVRRAKWFAKNLAMLPASGDEAGKKFEK
jgi:hypothetical protein